MTEPIQPGAEGAIDWGRADAWAASMVSTYPEDAHPSRRSELNVARAYRAERAALDHLKASHAEEMREKVEAVKQDHARFVDEFESLYRHYGLESDDNLTLDVQELKTDVLAVMKAARRIIEPELAALRQRLADAEDVIARGWRTE